MKAADGHDDMIGVDGAAGCRHAKARSGGRATLETLDRRPGMNRRLDDLRVAGDPGCNLVAWHEAISIVAVVWETRQCGGPVRADESEGIPAVLPAAAKATSTLENDVFSPGLAQVPAHRQPSLPTTDDGRVDVPRELVHGLRVTS
jgi:hypothetical protein